VKIETQTSISSQVGKLEKSRPFFQSEHHCPVPEKRYQRHWHRSKLNSWCWQLVYTYRAPAWLPVFLIFFEFCTRDTLAQKTDKKHDTMVRTGFAAGHGVVLYHESRFSSSCTNRTCCQCRVFCLFSIKVCPWYKNQKNSKKTGNHAGVRYVPKLSVPGIQFRVVSVSLRVFSGHKTMMYKWKVGSTIFTNLRRHRGLDFHFIFNGRVDIYTPSSTVIDGDYREAEVKILNSGSIYQPKLIMNIICHG